MIKYATYAFFRNKKTGELIQVPFDEEDHIDKKIWEKDLVKEAEEMEKIAHGEQ